MELLVVIHVSILLYEVARCYATVVSVLFRSIAIDLIEMMLSKIINCWRIPPQRWVDVSSSALSLEAPALVWATVLTF